VGLAPSPPDQLEGLGEHCKLPRVWGGAPAEIEFLHILPKNMTPGGNNFDKFLSGNQHNNLQILDATTDKDINRIQLM